MPDRAKHPRAAGIANDDLFRVMRLRIELFRVAMIRERDTDNEIAADVGASGADHQRGEMGDRKFPAAGDGVFQGDCPAALVCCTLYGSPPPKGGKQHRRVRSLPPGDPLPLLPQHHELIADRSTLGFEPCDLLVEKVAIAAIERLAQIGRDGEMVGHGGFCDRLFRLLPAIGAGAGG